MKSGKRKFSVTVAQARECRYLPILTWSIRYTTFGGSCQSKCEHHFDLVTSFHRTSHELCLDKVREISHDALE